MNTVEITRKLSEANGVSGNEVAVRATPALHHARRP